MSQETVIQLLRENPDKWFKARDVVAELGLSPSTVTSNLKRLRMSGFIETRIIRTTNGFEYKYVKD